MPSPVHSCKALSNAEILPSVSSETRILNLTQSPRCVLMTLVDAVVDNNSFVNWRRICFSQRRHWERCFNSRFMKYGLNRWRGYSAYVLHSDSSMCYPIFSPPYKFANSKLSFCRKIRHRFPRMHSNRLPDMPEFLFRHYAIVMNVDSEVLASVTSNNEQLCQRTW